jgi:hypothetical protein
MIIEDADYNIMIGTSSANIKSSFKVHIYGEIPPNRNVMHDVLAKDYSSTWGTEIRYCKEQYKPYVYCNSWCGNLTFKNCVLSDVHKIQIVATSVLGDGKITVKSNGEELCTIEVPASDGFYDFKECSGSLIDKHFNSIQDIELFINQGVGLLSFKLSK